METLLELIEGCGSFNSEKPKNASKAAALSGKLEALGFLRASKRIAVELLSRNRLAKIADDKYIVVHDKDIEKFLEKKVDQYNKKQPWDGATVSGTTTAAMAEQPPQVLSSIWRHTCHNSISREGTIGKYHWEEVKAQDYKDAPPEAVLEVLERDMERKHFDYYSVASVSEIKDPILFGRINGRPERFFITQWGDDVKLDDLI